MLNCKDENKPFLQGMWIIALLIERSAQTGPPWRRERVLHGSGAKWMVRTGQEAGSRMFQALLHGEELGFLSENMGDH